MKEYTVEALIQLLKQFDPNANIVVAPITDDDYESITDAQYNEHGDVELIIG